MDANKTSTITSFIEETYDQAFSLLVEDSIGIARIPEASYTRIDDELELHEPSFEFFDLLTWSVAISVLSAACAVVLHKLRPDRSTVLNSEEIEQIKKDLHAALSANTSHTEPKVQIDTEVRQDAIAYASRILVKHGWSAVQAQKILESMLREYESKLRVLQKTWKKAGPESVPSHASDGELQTSHYDSDVHSDILLVTVTLIETKAVLEAFGFEAERIKPHFIDGRVYFDLGLVNGTRVSLTRSEMGSGGLGASLLTVSKGIAALSPVAVVMVGIAFGVSDVKQSIGDVLVAEQLRPYDLQRVGTLTDGKVQIILRDDKPHSSSWLINLFKSAEITWTGATLRFGTILTGSKLVDNLDFRSQLCAFELEAVGGEMEGAGLYVACHDQKVDWCMVKAICDFADGHKATDKTERQTLAAKNAAAFVRHVMQFVKVDWNTHGTRRGVARRRSDQ